LKADSWQGERDLPLSIVVARGTGLHRPNPARAPERRISARGGPSVISSWPVTRAGAAMRPVGVAGIPVRTPRHGGATR
jgi:hypothetical protein